VRKLSTGTLVGYGSGAVAVAAKDAAVVHFLAFYYSQVVGLPAWLYGLSAFVAQAVDAFADPVLGTLSDNTRSRFGRRHPWMLASAVPIGVGFLLLFAPPSEPPDWPIFAWMARTWDALGSAISFLSLPSATPAHWAVFCWIALVQTGLRSLLSVFAIPHNALGAELSTDYEERTRIVSYRTLLAFIVGILLPAGAYALVFRKIGESDGRLVAANYEVYAWASAIAATLAVVIACATTWKLIPELPEARERRKLDVLDPLRDVIQALRNRNFRWIFLATVAIGASTGVTTILGTYTWAYFWEFSTVQAGALTLFSLAPTFLAFALLRPLGARFEKKRITLWCMAIFIANALWWYGGRLLGLLPVNGTGTIFALAFVHQFVVVAAVVIWSTMSPSMIADVADEHEVATGERKEGVFFAALAFAIKVPTGLGNALGGLLVYWVGLPALAQPGTIEPDAVFRLGLAAGPIVAASYLVPLWLFTRFSLTRERHAELRATLDGRRPTAR
jgi:glycoside/pentoside/hexuronide:cation symporter, GPH family